MKRRNLAPQLGPVSVAVALTFLLFTNSRSTQGQTMERVTEVEGITEYRLDNGLQVLLFPDNSAPKVTVNLTIFVGSRHEGYGEAGMAHLLEHMLFKGTPSHPNIPKSLQDRGAQFNGTTWVDRTNYYETLPASDDNLEFALRLEADRMVNSLIRAEDLASEMTVVRSEFERGENQPISVLLQRVQAAAFEWHNYGKSTIGNRSDIERVPIPNLRAFYRRHYQPDNAMLIVAGKFDPKKASELITKHFGVIPKSEDGPATTYTTEPAQDGERTVVLRRVGDVAGVIAAYHIPASSHEDFVSLQVLERILISVPSGRLYQKLVEPQLASSVLGVAYAFHDPGLMILGAQVPDTENLETVRQEMLTTIESLADSEFEQDVVDRAKNELLAQRERTIANSTQIAISLSDWAAQGDWRLFFIYRDRLEAVTPQDVQRVAQAYLRRNNRTVGLYIPTEESERVRIPEAPDIAKLVDGYEGREAIAQGEVFDPSPENIENRVTRSQLSTGIKLALLPKQTRGNTVNLIVSLRFGSEESLTNHLTAAELLPELMVRGTKTHSYAELREELNRLQATLSGSGQRGLATFTIQTKRDFLPQVLELVHDVLREPTLSADEFEVLKGQAISGLKARLSDPQALASRRYSRTTSPYPKDDIRYVPTLEEEVERLQAVQAADVREVYETLLNGEHGEIVIVGDFDQQEILPALETLVGDWQVQADFARIAQPALTGLNGELIDIPTPDKANAVYLAGINLAMRDSDENYAPLLIANDILGGGSLSSRLGDRVRQQEGLSYTVGSMLSAHPVDKRGSLSIFAIMNPANRDRLTEVIHEELELWIREGVTQDELDRARESFLQRRQLQRSSDAALARLLNLSIFASRDLMFERRLEDQVRNLTVDDVNQAIRSAIDSKHLIEVRAGDFNNE